MAPGYGAVGQTLHFGADPRRQRRLCRRGQRARPSAPRSATSPSSATPRRCNAASACPTASAITARRPRRPRPTSASSTNSPPAPGVAPVHAGQLMLALVVLGPLADAAMTYALTAVGGRRRRGDARATPGTTALALLPSAFIVAAALFVGSLATGLGAIYAFPRLLNLFCARATLPALWPALFPAAQRRSAISNSGFFNLLFGDSIFIESYLRFVRRQARAGQPRPARISAPSRRSRTRSCARSAPARSPPTA